MKRYQTAIILLTVLFLFIKANGQACGKYAINITVENEQDKPVTNASVRLLPIEKDETDGQKFVRDKSKPETFSISFTEGHSFKTFHNLQVSAPGFKQTENKVRFISCEKRSVIVKLMPVKSDLSAVWQFENKIDIRVFGDGKSLGNVKMQIIAEKREPETIDMGEWGSAYLTLPNGVYRLIFEKPGFETKEVTADLTPLADEHLKIELKPKE